MSIKLNTSPAGLGWILLDYTLDKPLHALGYAVATAMTIASIYFTLAVGAWAIFPVLTLLAMSSWVTKRNVPKIKKMFTLPHIAEVSKGWQAVFITAQIFLLKAAAAGFIGLIVCLLLAFLLDANTVITIAVYCAVAACWAPILSAQDPEPLIKKLIAGSQATREFCQAVYGNTNGTRQSVSKRAAAAGQSIRQGVTSARHAVGQRITDTRQSIQQSATQARQAVRERAQAAKQELQD